MSDNTDEAFHMSHLVEWQRAFLLRFHIVAFVEEQRNCLGNVTLLKILNHLVQVTVKDDAETLDDLLVLQVVHGLDDARQQ